MAGAVPLAAFVTAFYTSAAFRPERVLLGLLMPKRRADNADVAALAEGTTERFSAWSVEARSENQILLCDYQSRTRSWLMTAPLPAGGTRLHFGSAVTGGGKTGAAKRFDSLAFRALLVFHKAYARLLLRSALRRL